MASYVVMEPAGAKGGDAALFVKDAFALLALFLPALWLLWNRLWFEAAMVFLASLVLIGGAQWLGQPDLGGFATFLIGVYVALEGSALKIAALARRGYAGAAVVEASSLTEAEDRYYFGRAPMAEALSSGPPRPAPSSSAPAAGTGWMVMPGAHA